MRIVFMGTPAFAVPCLEALCASGRRVVGVFTQPDRPRGRGKKPAPSPVKEAAQALGLPVFQPERIRKDGLADLRSLAPDLCVTAAFGQILSQEVLDIPPLGNLNVHASLLPRHRGAAPIARAIMAGEKRTGVTTMRMDAGIDTGPILLQAETDIGERETCGELTDRLSRLGADLLLKTLEALEAGTLRDIPQDESLMTYDPMLTKDLSDPDFTLDANRVRGQINGLNPWPCASIPIPEGRLKLLRAEEATVDPAPGADHPAPGADHPAPGTLLCADGKRGLVIACGAGAVRILEVQAPGGKPMRAEDYLRGHALGTKRL